MGTGIFSGSCPKVKDTCSGFTMRIISASSIPPGPPRNGLIKPDTDVTRALQVIAPAILDCYLRGEPELDEAAREALVLKSLGGKVRSVEWETK